MPCTQVEEYALLWGIHEVHPSPQMSIEYRLTLHLMPGLGVASFYNDCVIILVFRGTQTIQKKATQSGCFLPWLRKNDLFNMATLLFYTAQCK
ncbi:hypothetical protein ACTXT7_007555 [Hymenolepis weldensis]